MFSDQYLYHPSNRSKIYQKWSCIFPIFMLWFYLLLITDKTPVYRVMPFYLFFFFLFFFFLIFIIILNIFFLYIYIFILMKP